MLMIQRFARIQKLRKLLILTIILLALSTSIGFSKTPALATEVVEEAIQTVNYMLNNDFPKAKIHAGIEEMFINFSDTNYIGRVALGRPWQTLSEKQKRLFLKIFQRYLAEKYASHFPKFIGGKYEVIQARTTRNDQTYEIVTTMYLTHEPPFPIYWHLVNINEQPRIRNIIVDDLNLLVLEKKILNSLLEQSGGNVNVLMKKLKFRYR